MPRLLGDEHKYPEGWKMLNGRIPVREADALKRLLREQDRPYSDWLLEKIRQEIHQTRHTPPTSKK